MAKKRASHPPSSTTAESTVQRKKTKGDNNGKESAAERAARVAFQSEADATPIPAKFENLDLYWKASNYLAVAQVCYLVWTQRMA